MGGSIWSDISKILLLFTLALKIKPKMMRAISSEYAKKLSI